MQTVKDGFIQIRISVDDKRAIQRAARQAGMGISEWMLRKALPEHQQRFQEIIQSLVVGKDRAYVLAELNDFLTGLTGAEFRQAVAMVPPAALLPETLNYVAAMVECAAGRLGIDPPGWTPDVAVPEEPYFGTDLGSLRFYLLTRSPLPFRQRNIFIDATLGDRR
jgi:hypothetical protein